jgi:hypothetical protein
VVTVSFYNLESRIRVKITYSIPFTILVMKKLFSMTAFFLLAFFCAGGSAPAQSAFDIWNGLIIDVSTTDDAVRLFGAADKVKDKQSLVINRAESWLSGEQKKKVFQTLVYKQIKEYKNVELAFLDAKLVMISLEAPDAYRESNWLDPDDLPAMFNLSFRPYARKIGKTRPFYTDYPTTAPTELTKQGYKTWYDFMAVGEKFFVIAIVDNAENFNTGEITLSDPVGLGEKDRRYAIDTRGKYPGYVSYLQIISRRLAAEKK